MKDTLGMSDQGIGKGTAIRYVLQTRLLWIAAAIPMLLVGMLIAWGGFMITISPDEIQPTGAGEQDLFSGIISLIGGMTIAAIALRMPFYRLVVSDSCVTIYGIFKRQIPLEEVEAIEINPNLSGGITELLAVVVNGKRRYVNAPMFLGNYGGDLHRAKEEIESAISDLLEPQCGGSKI